ncbi:MAG: hypothetical protein VKL41_04055 [Snowella sp.]|nr:hypothetical protein [Snowella sp.]
MMRRIFSVFTLGTALSIATAFPSEAQPKTYTCKFLGINQGVELSPRISGSSTREWSCYVPVSAGRCVGINNKGNPFQPLLDSPSDFVECTPAIITDPVTKKKYYEFTTQGKDVVFKLDK